MKNLRDRIKAMFLMVPIDDALGMPVETFTAEQIREHLKKLGIDGRLTTYLRPDGHRWFNGREAGTITDDYLFSRITMESLIKMRGFDMDDMAKRHVEPYANGTLKNFGAGKSTREALRNLNNGIHWSQSGVKGGAGNGIAMKIAPIAAYVIANFLKKRKDMEKPLAVSMEEWLNFWDETIKDVYDYTLMTHNSRMALESAFAQIYGISNCLLYGEIVPFNCNIFLKQIIDGAIQGSKLKFGNNLFDDGAKDTLSSRLIELKKDFNAGKLNDTEYIIQKYAGTGKSTGYILNSIPFSYAFFLRNPYSIDAIYDVVNAGGDTDTNAAIIGPMLGALNGTKIIPEHLLTGLKVREEAERLADQFCDVFGITD